MLSHSSLLKIVNCPRLCFFKGLVFLLLSVTTPLQAHANAHDLQSTCTLPFGEGLSAKSVQIIAKSYAYTQAIMQVQEDLKKNKAISFGLENANLSFAIAAQLYKYHVSTNDINYAASSGDVSVTITLALRSKTTNVGNLLSQYDLLELRLELIELLMDYAEKGQKLVLVHAGIQKSGQNISKQDAREALMNISRHLEALWLYDLALGHFKETWSNPTLVQQTLKDALILAPSMSALWAAIGEVQIQLDQPQTALQNLNHALALFPERARTYYVRGLGHLRLQQPALAMTDLNTALSYKPQMVAWLRARGSIALVLEDYATMCEDFEQACTLGDCEGLVHARERDFCLK